MAETTHQLPKLPRDAKEAAYDGGCHHRKPVITKPARSGEEALEEWEKNGGQGPIDVPAYQRRGQSPKRTGREAFSPT